MKKILNFALVLMTIFSLSSQASVDLSALYNKVSKPSVEEIQKSLDIFLKQMEGTTLNQAQKNALDALVLSIRGSSQKATLKRQKSQGPSWKQKALEFLYDNYDIAETVTYTGENGDVAEICDFNDEGIDEIIDWKFEWDSVKPIQGSKKSVAYIVQLVVSLAGYDIKNNESKLCEYTLQEWAFEANLDSEGDVIEIKNFE